MEGFNNSFRTAHGTAGKPDPLTHHNSKLETLMNLNLVKSLSFVGVLLAGALLSGCAQMVAQAQAQQQAIDERDCNPGSQCYRSLTPEQKVQLVAIKQEAAQREKDRQLQRDALQMLQNRLPRK